MWTLCKEGTIHLDKMLKEQIIHRMKDSINHRDYMDLLGEKYIKKNCGEIFGFQKKNYTKTH